MNKILIQLNNNKMILMVVSPNKIQMTMNKEFKELRKAWRMMRLIYKENKYLAIYYYL